MPGIMGKIVWLASYPKSGNTWMRAFLHNLMLAAPEPHDINRLDALTGGDVEPGLYAELAGRPAEGLSVEQAIALRGPVQRRLAAAAQGSRFVKTHSALLHIYDHDTIDMSVTAGAIYIVRDPRDIVLSFAPHLGESPERIVELMATDNAHTAASAQMMPDVIGSWSQHVESWTARPSAGLHVVRYEDMVRDTQRCFAAVAAFLGLNVPSARLATALKNSSFKVLAGQERRRGFRERPQQAQRFFRKGTAGSWRSELAPELARAIETRHAVQMRRFGYLPGGGEGGS